MEIVKSAIPFILLCYVVIYTGYLLNSYKTRRPKKPHSADNVIDWKAQYTTRQDPRLPDPSRYTSWTTTTVTFSGEDRPPVAQHILDPLPMIKEVRFDPIKPEKPVKLKTRFELLKGDPHADKS